MSAYRERMTELMDRHAEQIKATMDLLEFAPAFNGFRAQGILRDYREVAERLRLLANETDACADAMEKERAGRIEAERRIDAYVASRKPAEVQ